MPVQDRSLPFAKAWRAFHSVRLAPRCDEITGPTCSCFNRSILYQATAEAFERLRKVRKFDEHQIRYAREATLADETTLSAGPKLPCQSGEAQAGHPLQF